MLDLRECLESYCSDDSDSDYSEGFYDDEGFEMYSDLRRFRSSRVDRLQLYSSNLRKADEKTKHDEVLFAQNVGVHLQQFSRRLDSTIPLDENSLFEAIVRQVSNSVCSNHKELRLMAISYGRKHAAYFSTMLGMSEEKIRSMVERFQLGLVGYFQSNVPELHEHRDFMLTVIQRALDINIVLIECGAGGTAKQSGFPENCQITSETVVIVYSGFPKPYYVATSNIEPAVKLTESVELNSRVSSAAQKSKNSHVASIVDRIANIKERLSEVQFPFPKKKVRCAECISKSSTTFCLNKNRCRLAQIKLHLNK